MTIGDDRILYFSISSSWVPVGCLTSNSISETTEMIDCTTRDDGEWAVSRPMSQSYSISFDGIAELTGSIVNIDDIRALFRARTKVSWKIDGGSGFAVYSGSGYITTMSESAAVGDYITFSCTLDGYIDITTS